jgi:hypothetical protein
MTLVGFIRDQCPEVLIKYPGTISRKFKSSMVIPTHVLIAFIAEQQGG